MACPFPGMDPFIEGDSWRNFHARFTIAIADFLTARVRPRYLVRAEERVYLEHVPEDDLPRSFWPDLSVVTERSVYGAPSSATATAILEAPSIVGLPMPVRQREHYLTIVLRETMDVVTIIEILSPTNKRAGSDGSGEYLAKREAILLSHSHLVELDLLRGGGRLPTIQPLPPGDYYALVSRVARRPNAEVYAWPLLHRMPAIPIPLATGDEDAVLDLQAVFNTVYERSDYDYSLDYSRALNPPLGEADAARVDEALRARLGG